MNIHLRELDENDDIATQPPRINITLKRHQLTLLHAMKNLERTPIYMQDFFLKTQIGILGDPVGSGKSFVILSHILEEMENESNIEINTFANGLIIMNKIILKRTVDTNVIVIPHCLTKQWQDYIKQFKSDMPYHLLSRKQHFTNFEVSKHKLIIVTCTMYKQFLNIVNQENIKIKRIFFDEADILNCDQFIVDSHFYWFVSASFENFIYPRGFYDYSPQHERYILMASGLKYNGFIKNIFIEMLGQSIVKHLVIKNKDDYVKNSIFIPNINVKEIECKNNTVLNILKDVIDTRILNCLNANDVHSAMKLLGYNTQSEEAIVYKLVENFQNRVHDIDVTITYHKMLHSPNEDEIKKLETEKTNLLEKISCVKERISNTENCPICFNDIEEKCILNCCSNVFCLQCSNRWFAMKSFCPLCKKNINLIENLHICTNPNKPISNLVSKSENLYNILSENLSENRHFLILSSFENSFKEIELILQNLKIEFSYLKGNNYTINNQVENYKKNKIKVLLVNATHYGAGLNLENTTDLIMFHRLDSTIEKQVIGRANRYGRTCPLNVWYLLYQNELRTGVS